MKKSVKIIGILLIIGILFVVISNTVTNNASYYNDVADIIINFYRSSDYDETLIKKNDRPAVEKYLSTLTHENEEICVSDYVIKTKEYKTNEMNSNNIYIKNNKCYVKYDSLKISKTSKSNYDEIENYDLLICNGYKVILYKSMFNDDYDVTIKNPRYDYIFDKSEENNDGYIFTYKSSYDGSKIDVILYIDGKKIDRIEVK